MRRWHVNHSLFGSVLGVFAKWVSNQIPQSSSRHNYGAYAKVRKRRRGCGSRRFEPVASWLRYFRLLICSLNKVASIPESGKAAINCHNISTNIADKLIAPSCCFELSTHWWPRHARASHFVRRSCYLYAWNRAVSLTTKNASRKGIRQRREGPQKSRNIIRY